MATLREKDFLPFKPDEDMIPPMADFGSGYRYHGLIATFADELRSNGVKI